MKRVRMLATGGTISCRAGDNGLAPALSGAQLLRSREDIRVEVGDLMAVDSTDVTDEQRLLIAKTIWAERDTYDGFVVTHGTDTMAYTAALLGRMLKNFHKPVILTGSMLPMEAPDSDAPDNLDGALCAAASDYRGTAVYFDAQLYRACAVTKFHSSHKRAFACAGGLGLDGERLRDGRLQLYACPEEGEARFVWPIFNRAAVLYVTPALTLADVRACAGRAAVIVLGYGMGGVPGYLLPAFEELIHGGTRVYVTSQCPLGGADSTHYAVGRRLQASGAVGLGCQTLEDALACVAVGLL